jgi:hypothetical protein
MRSLRMISRPSSLVLSRRVGLSAATKVQQISFPQPWISSGLSRPSHATMATTTNGANHGDLNNTEVLRKTVALPPDSAYARTTLAIPEDKDDQSIRSKYRSFLLPKKVTANDWISKLELSTALKMAEADMERTGGDRLKVVVLYGSMRSRCVASRFLRFGKRMLIVRSVHILDYSRSNAHAYCSDWDVTFECTIQKAYR